MSETKTDRKYTTDHEWALSEDGSILIGITSFAVDQLGDITLVDIDVGEGDTVAAGAAFGTIESVKTLSDLFAPMSGTVIKINPALEEAPETINDDCWGSGWMIAIKPDDEGALEKLLDADAYDKHLADSDH